MTLKQQKLVAGIANGKTQTQAAIAAGYAPAGAHVSASRALNDVKVQSALAALMDKQGLSERKLLAPIKDAIEATKDSDAPDHVVRLKAAEIGWKLRGHLSPSINQTVNAPSTINILHAYRPMTNGHGAV